MTGEQEVLIVGAGPTGMTAAIELTRAGIPVRIIDKSDHMARWSQALVVQARTLEQFQRYGLAEQAVQRGRKLTGARILRDGQELVHVKLDGIPSRYPFLLMIPQTETEALLNGHMEQMGVRTERQVELVALTQGDDGLQVHLRHADGREEHVKPAWLLGCDGAHSTVRSQLKVPFEGQAIALRFILGDLRLQGPDVPGDELTVHFHRGGDVVFLARMQEDLTRVIVVRHGEEPEGPHELTTDDFQGELDRCGVRVKVTGAEWMTPFSVNDRQAEQYRIGRVFLAGDASHIHSPVGGQGMNTGIQDVANLAWKLAAVMRGAPVELLDSYHEERGEVGRQLLQSTERVLRMATSESQAMEGARDLLMSVASRLPVVQREISGFVSETAIAYRGSSAVRDAGGDGDLRAGDRVPDVALHGRGTLLRDWTDAKPLVLALESTEEQVGVLRKALPHAQVRTLSTAELDDEGQRLFGTESKLVVVRPDGYVGFRGPAEAREALTDYVQQVGLS